MYRLAGVTHEEAITTLGASMKVLDYTVKGSGREPLKPTDEVHAAARATLDEIYEMDPFSEAIANASASKKVQACIDAAEEAMPKPEENKRMMPQRGA